jgi:hypothetical protein
MAVSFPSSRIGSVRMEILTGRKVRANHDAHAPEQLKAAST